MKIFLSTREGYMKDLTPESKRNHKNKGLDLSFTGEDAPLKAARALIEKYGIRIEDL
jgi:hypothetical protein